MPDTRIESLSDDTAVEQDGGQYRAEVGLRWDNSGRPVGAILAGAMVRAASAEAGMPAVVSTTTEFLNPARLGAAEITCEVVRRSSVLCCVSTAAVQEGHTVCRGTTWLSAAQPRRIQSATPADVPDWSTIPSAEERAGTEDFPFSRVLEQRPLLWLDDFAGRPESAPCGLTWVRFRPSCPTRDLVTRACEVLVAGDLYPPITMIVASPRHQAAAARAQTIALSAHLGPLENESEHLLIEASIESLSDMVLTGVVRVWDESMALCGQVTTSYRIPRAQPLWLRRERRSNDVW